MTIVSNFDFLLIRLYCQQGVKLPNSLLALKLYAPQTLTESHQTSTTTSTLLTTQPPQNTTTTIDLRNIAPKSHLAALQHKLMPEIMASESKAKNTTLRKTHNSESQKRKNTTDDGPHDIPPPSKKQNLDGEDHQPVRRSKRNMPAGLTAKNTILNKTHNSDSQKRKDGPYESAHDIPPSKKQKLEYKDNKKPPRQSNRENAASKNQKLVQDKEVPHTQEDNNHGNARVAKKLDSANSQDKEHTSNPSTTGKAVNTHKAKQPKDQASEDLESREQTDGGGLSGSLELVQKKNTRSNAKTELEEVHTGTTTKSKERASNDEPNDASSSKKKEHPESSRLEGESGVGVQEASDDHGLASELRATSRLMYGDESPYDVHEILKHMRSSHAFKKKEA